MKKIFSGIKNSFSGLALAFKHDQSIRLEIITAIILFIILIFLDLNFSKKMAMASSVIFVICVELLNTSIEKLADKVNPHYDEAIKFIKDSASAAVFLSILINCLVWISCLFF